MKIFNRNYFISKEINPIVRILTMVDISVASGLGLVAPIFAVFIVDNIKGAGIETVGIATAIYLITKSLSQVPVGILIDKIKGERDDFIFLFLGFFTLSVIPFLYIFAKSILILFIIQFFYGIANGFTEITWNAIFSRHLDKNKEGIEWSIYNTLSDFGGAASAAIGSFFVAIFGFNALFIAISIFNLSSLFFLSFVYRDFLLKKVR